jgi:hypothetical protein
MLVACALVVGTVGQGTNVWAQLAEGATSAEPSWSMPAPNSYWPEPALFLQPVPPRSEWISDQMFPIQLDEPVVVGQPLESRSGEHWPVDQVSWEADCSSCNGSNIQNPANEKADAPALLGGCSTVGACSTCGVGSCTPGCSQCYPCNARTRIGRFACEIYHALCCPDPCYDPKWMPLADSAFFVEAVRPVTQQRLRWDAGLQMVFPDRAEYFWARADGSGKGPSANAPWQGVRSLTYHDLSLYTETSSGKFSMFVNQPYRSVYPSDTGHGAGLSALDLGTKTLVFDCELLQIAFQFRTYMPMGNTTKGLGNGHVSLEPSLIVGLRLSPDSYLQGQVAEWIPLGGDADYAGAILHYHASVNHVWFRMLPDVPLIATCELNGWSFQDGAYTDPLLGTRSASGETYLSMGPGLRLSICDTVDFGVGTAFALTKDHFAEQLIRSEFRWRF